MEASKFDALKAKWDGGAQWNGGAVTKTTPSKPDPAAAKQLAQVAQQVTVPDQPVPDQNDLNLNTFTHEVATSFVSQSKEVKEIGCTVATRNADIAAQNADIGKNGQKTIDGIAAQQAALLKEILKTSSSSS